MGSAFYKLWLRYLFPIRRLGYGILLLSFLSPCMGEGEGGDSGRALMWVVFRLIWIMVRLGPTVLTVSAGRLFGHFFFSHLSFLYSSVSLSLAETEILSK